MTRGDDIRPGSVSLPRASRAGVPLRVALPLVALTLVAAACGSGGSAVRARTATPTTAAAGPAAAGPATPPQAGGKPDARPLTPYQAAVDAAAQRGLVVWIDIDLPKFWLQGPSRFEATVRTLGKLAGRPGVVGVRIADELGYQDGFHGDGRRVQQFLHDAASALKEFAPRRRVLADFVVPELGCAPNVPAAAGPSARCRAVARDKYPALTLEAIDGYIASGTVDVVDVSTSLLDEIVYRSWGTSEAEAQRAAWREITRRNWSARVVVQSRKALAHPGPYGETASETARDLDLFVDIPRQEGAMGTDIWTWRQTYRGQVVRLPDPGLEPNPLWEGLRARRRQGAVLFTHFTPSSVERGLDPDMDMLAQVFSGVFVAAGLG